MKQLITVWLAFAAILGATRSIGDESVVAADVSQITAGKGWKLTGRKATLVVENGKRAVSFNIGTGSGVAWLDGFDLSEGEIDLDIRGVDKDQQSFLGVAFNVVDGVTHDAIYFRPFNFLSTSSVKHAHAVQYVSHPEHTWKKLRDEHPGTYENPLNPPPDPNKWFHVRLLLTKREVSVYVEKAKEPCLKVQKLSDRTGGSVGLFVGDGSGGTFANLKITRKYHE